MSNPRKPTPHSPSPLYWSAETWAIISLRLFLGLRLFIAGLGKFKNEQAQYSFSNYYDGSVARMTADFAERTNLPNFLVGPYAHSIAYIEIVIGVLVLAGIKTKYSLALTSLTFVSLAFGQMLLKNNATVADIGVHIALCVAALYFVRHNKLEALR